MILLLLMELEPLFQQGLEPAVSILSKEGDGGWRQAESGLRQRYRQTKR